MPDSTARDPERGPEEAAREVEEWKRFATLMWRIGLALCVCLSIAAGLIAYLLRKGCG